MPDWIDMDSADVGADRPLHAGMLHAVRGNLEQAITESGHRYQSIAHGASDYGNHVCLIVDEYEDLTPEWGWWPVQIRRGFEGELRQIRVILEGLVKTAGTTIGVRLYALAGIRSALTVDPTDGLIGETAYDDADFTAQVWEEKTFEITLSGSDRVGGDTIREDIDVPDTSYEEICLVAIAQSDVVPNEYIRLRPPYIDEVVP